MGNLQLINNEIIAKAWDEFDGFTVWNTLR